LTKTFFSKIILHYPKNQKFIAKVIKTKSAKLLIPPDLKILCHQEGSIWETSSGELKIRKPQRDKKPKKQ
jgi:hypothetical protein